MTGTAWALAGALKVALAVTFKTVATVEVVGAGDDRAASRLETVVQADLDGLVACWAAAKPDDDEPLHFLTAIAKMNPLDGRIRRWDVSAATGSEALDACLADRAATWVIAPAPQFADRYRVTIRYAWVDEAGRLAAPPKP
ncbi:MAG: hypothetical protein RLZZ383_1342 [Pseudomonadota bacterium]